MEKISLSRQVIARVLSDVFSPPVVWGVLSIPIAVRAAGSVSLAVPWAIIYIVFVCILPAVYIVVQVLRGKITDIHVRVRQQRILPFLITVGCSALACALLSVLGSPLLLTQFALITTLQVFMILVITLWWQISLHAMSIMTAVIVVGALYGFAPALVATPLIPIVGAARVVLRRHTVQQVIAGGLLGAAMTLTMVLLMGISF